MPTPEKTASMTTYEAQKRPSTPGSRVLARSQAKRLPTNGQNFLVSLTPSKRNASGEKRLRKLADPVGGPALLAAIRYELLDP